MPAMDGIELCRAIKQDRRTQFVPVVLVTGFGDREARLAGINAGADEFLTKPVSSDELRARVQSLLRMKRSTDDLDSAEAVIISLSLTVEARDPLTGGHCVRMAAYGATFGHYLGLGKADTDALRRGGYLHDVGKIGVPDAVLLKPAALTSDEFVVMQRHPVLGASLCGTLRILDLVRPIIRHHHERYDGSGYPDGLAGDRIPLLAQITGIVDVFDALTSNRPYRAALPRETACAELEREAELGWRQPALVREFVDLCRSGQLDRPEDGVDA